MKIKFTLIFLSLSFFSITRGQDDFSIQFNYANNLFSNKQYYDAITEYKRLLFFDSTKIYQYEANLKIGESYKAGSKYDDAIKYFSFSELNARNVDEIFESKTQIIRVNILRRTTDRALQLCDELEKDERFSTKSDSIYYWRGWALMFADDWNNAAKTFAKINPNHELKLLAERTDDAKVSVTFARVISYILPGAGAIYTGKILSGFLSLGWNILSGYLTINSFIEKRAFDGIVTGELLWLRFYRGAIQNGEDFAIEKNLVITNKSLRFLQNEYKGVKL
jgi:tetratricopeptide (TPR) repeat protein